MPDPNVPKPMRQPPPYRRTLMDRFGPDLGHVLVAVGWSALGAVMFLPVALFHSPPGWPVFVTIPLFYITGWAGLSGIALLLIRPGSAVAEFYLAPTGASTPYQEQFSQEAALVMQERVAEALLLFEQRIAADPAGVAVRIRAADLYAAQGKNATRAAELFREAQRIDGLTSGDDLYIGNRLADLFMGPLNTPARALVELRRLLDRYPDSRVAPQLRQAIASLKSRHVIDERDH